MHTMNGWKKAGSALGILIVILGYGWLLWKGPWLFDGSHIRKAGLQPADGVVITGFRTMLVAVGAGVIAAFGLIYTHRNHQLARQQFEHTQEQFTLAQEQFRLAQEQFRQTQEQFAYEQDKDREAADRDREGRVTEQYVTAVKLLGSNSHAERMGAIYSLQRLSRDSDQYLEPIEMLLSSFVQEREAAVEKERKEKLRREGGTVMIGYDDEDVANGEIVTPFGTDCEAARNALHNL